MLSRILSAFLFVLAFALAYYLYHSIKSEIDTTDRIKAREQVVIEQLKLIRRAQNAYHMTHHTYTPSWDTLIRFVEEGNIYIIDRKEHIITLDYGADSVYIELDTIGVVLVRDSLFSPQEYPNFDAQTLAYIPGRKEQRFDLWTQKTELGGVPVNLIEVKDTAPVNPRRSEDSEIRSLKPLRFGSREQVTLSGNWE